MSDPINFDEISREGLIDMLEEATDRLEEKSALISQLKQRLVDTEQNELKLKEKNEGLRLDNAEYIEWLEHLLLVGSHDDCPTCNDITAFLQRLEAKSK
jgi:DNA repair exonuclease SbcCD ATPase subunit